MKKLMKLKGRVECSPDDWSKTFHAEMYDGTPLSLQVEQHDFEQNEPFTDDKLSVRGWLFVVEEAKQDTRCYLTLPKPSIQYGRQIVVHELSLMPRAGDISMFSPQITKPPVPPETGSNS